MNVHTSPGRAGTPNAAAFPDQHRGWLARVADVAFRRRRLVVAAWLTALTLVLLLAGALGGDFTADYTARGSDSRAAGELLETRFPTRAGEVVDVVVRADEGLSAPWVRAELDRFLSAVGGVDHVVDTTGPDDPGGQVSEDGRTGVAHIHLDVPGPSGMPVERTQELITLAEGAERPGLQVELGGVVIQTAESGEPGSEGIGLVLAAVVLLVTFGTVVAAGLPLLIAVVGLVATGGLISLAAVVVDTPDWATSLAAMMGIGIGIDYVLLMVSRFRELVAHGFDARRAAVAMVDTAGRSVLVAGGTVIVSMLGLFATGLTYMQGAAVATILAVLVVMSAAVTLLPALLGLTSRHLDRFRLPGTSARTAPSRRWTAWSLRVQRHPILALTTGLVLLVGMSLPFLDVRFGFPDAGNDAAGTTSRQAYDLVVDGFGPGSTGPLLVTVDLTGSDDRALRVLSDRIGRTPGVLEVAPPALNPAGDTAVITAIPDTAPQTRETEDLVKLLREEIAAETASLGITAHVGGATAASVDVTADLSSRLPVLIGGVLLVSLLLLLLAFRSIAVAVKAGVLNLLSIAAAYGTVAVVLQGGRAGSLIGIDTPTPLPAFIPVLMFPVLFGLSMDYEVFLLSRIRERWVATGSTSRAVTEGLASTARVITAAASIMVLVFVAFIPSDDISLKLLGVGLATAVLVDATLVRMLLVPAAMQLLGRASWWLPGWLDRALPELHVEGPPPAEVRPIPRPRVTAPHGHTLIH